MSSFGGNQWKVIRHYLSLSNLNAEVEKLVQRIKPATPEQWESLIKRFEKAMSIKLSQTSIETEQSKSLGQMTNENTLKATTIEETNTKTVIKDKVEKPEEKISQEGLTLGNEMKEITVEGLWRGMKLKKDLYMGKVSDQSWKSNKPAITKTSIHSRTAYVISALVTAETLECMQKRTEDLISHLRSYPECRDYAIKEGAIRALLRLQRKSQYDTPIAKEVSGTIQQALALLGYVGPTKGPGPHILAIDGGGIRGLITIEILRHLEKLTGRRVNELFDYIIGVSTGAIIAAVIGSGVGTLDTAHEMYRTLSTKMFGNTSFIGGTSRLVFSHAFYDTVEWESLLKSHLKDCTLLDCNKHDVPKMALVSCVVNTAKITPFLFRTYECGFRVRSVHPGTAHAPLWCAVRASAAAPTYFQEFSHEGLLHQDGGIMANNPTAVGLHEAKLLYGADALKNATIISVGNGKLLKNDSNYQLMLKGANKGATGTSWKEKFYMILESATNTEAVHQVLNDSLPPGTYYRFNPTLGQECSMTEIDPDKLAGMLVDTAAYIRRNQHKFERAAAALCRQRSVAQRVADQVRYRAHLMGVTHTK